MKKILLILLSVFILTGCSGRRNIEEPQNDDELLAQPTVAEEEPVYERMAFITIDDGPSRENTPVILDLLRDAGVKATFFVLPHSGMDDIYKRIRDEGHEIGNHSYSHDFNKLYGDNLEDFKDDVLRAREFIQDKLGVTTTVFRFPGGSMGRRSQIIDPRRRIVEDLGYRWFDWHVSTGDTDTSPAGKNVEALVNNVVNNTHGREKLVILMHDSSDKTATPAALKIIIEKLREQGYGFGVLSNY
jgi:peptidoglycan/xylan/chitin deacetylase (PgdA/CDA1 family)